MNCYRANRVLRRLEAATRLGRLAADWPQVVWQGRPKVTAALKTRGKKMR